MVAAFSKSVAGGLFTLVIGAPLVALLYVIYTRVLLEVLIAIFRIMELNAEQVALLRQAQGLSAPQPPAAAPRLTGRLDRSAGWPAYTAR